jgi:hypothetical protein
MMKLIRMDSLLALQGASVNYRIAMGPQQGQKVFTLQTLPVSIEGEYGQLANTSGFSLHAGVFANADEPEKLERLCRCISRPAISEQRLSMTQHGKVRYELKTPYRDGTTHVFFDPLDFIGKLSALIPPPRLNLTRFFGVFAPNSNLRAQVTASQRGKNSPRITNQGNEQSDKPYQAKSMTWAQRLKRVFNIDISECEKCEKHKILRNVQSHGRRACTQFPILLYQRSNKTKTETCHISKNYQNILAKNI